MRIDLAGIHIPSVTPFDPVTGDIDLLALRANLRRWLGFPVRGIVIAGSTGESVLLNREERRALLEAARGVIPENRLLVAGTGSESTRETLRLTRDAADAGADAVLVQPPSFFRSAMDRATLTEHYSRVADAASVPVILYQVPLQLSTVELPTSLVIELSEHPNVIGMKDSRGDLDALGTILTGSAEGFQVLGGDGAKLYASLEVGAVGGIVAVANLVAREVSELARAFTDGRTSEAGRIQERVGPLAKRVVGRLGVPGIKAALDLLGLQGGNPRAPLRVLDEAGLGSVREQLQRAGLPFTTPASGPAPIPEKSPENLA